ncbi:DUF4123 domain-containing protein [Alcanivorax sp. 24]|uniref:DUF4123 domain-containing protein n=1 Tax=Alcanivorax sp. 24 TaxID=2545266 RepID=UPI001414F11A|nr:DUF4123 domain-containing protein [Alcanivorax sp. 24]
MKNTPHLTFLRAHDYALLNPLQVESQFWQGLPSESLAPSAYIAQQHLFPRLIKLSEVPAEGLETLLKRSDAHGRYSQKPFFSALLISSVSHESLTDHLRRQSVLRAPIPARETGQLRYHDPLVFRHMMWLLTRGQMRSLLGPIDCWSWFDSEQGWRQNEREPGYAGQRWFPDKSQWKSFKRMGLLNRCLKHWAKLVPSLTGREDFWRRSDEMLRLSREAAGLVEEADRRLYAEQELRYPGVTRHERLVERLGRVHEGITSYSVACQDMSDNVLRQCRVELMRSQHGG